MCLCVFFCRKISLLASKVYLLFFCPNCAYLLAKRCKHSLTLTLSGSLRKGRVICIFHSDKRVVLYITEVAKLYSFFVCAIVKSDHFLTTFISFSSFPLTSPLWGSFYGVREQSLLGSLETDTLVMTDEKKKCDWQLMGGGHFLFGFFGFSLEDAWTYLTDAKDVCVCRTLNFCYFFLSFLFCLSSARISHLLITYSVYIIWSKTAAFLPQLLCLLPPIEGN